MRGCLCCWTRSCRSRHSRASGDGPVADWYWECSCDFDRLWNHHQTIRAFLGHGDFDDKTRYEYQTVVDNVSLLTPELLSAVGPWRADTR